MEYEVNDPAVKYSRYVSPQEYLQAERLAEQKHEYFEGDIIVMQGASLNHNRMLTSIVGEVRNKLKDKGCEILSSDMRAASPNFKSFMYPDATIVCGEPKLSDENFDTLQNPTIIFEVVSKSSFQHDYQRKFLYYKQIDSLQEYVLIDSFEKVQVDVFRRNMSNQWLMETYLDMGDILELQSIGISIPLTDIYNNISFEPMPEGQQ